MDSKRPLLSLLLCATLGAGDVIAQEGEPRVILVTVDGLRWEEVFTGVDAALLDDPAAAGVKDTSALRARFWRDTPAERRAALLPYFWGDLVGRGTVWGDRTVGSRVRLVNPHHFSYPGYAEILTGRFLPEIDSNDPVRMPVPTVLEHAKAALGLARRDVAVFASWERFQEIVEREPGSLVVSAGFSGLPDGYATPRLAELAEIQHDLLTPWDSVRHDWVTAEMALEYLRAYEPRILYVALGETDDWAHERRYDRTLQAAVLFDDFLRDLFAFVDGNASYAGNTTVLVTSDHGRGPDGTNWTDHGARVPGAETDWIAIFGGRAALRGVVGGGEEVLVAQVAATLLAALGLDPAEYAEDAAPPIGDALSPR